MYYTFIAKKSLSNKVKGDFTIGFRIFKQIYKILKPQKQVTDRLVYLVTNFTFQSKLVHKRLFWASKEITISKYLKNEFLKTYTISNFEFVLLLDKIYCFGNRFTGLWQKSC